MFNIVPYPSNSELVKLIDKILVVYKTEDEDKCLWRIIPKAEISYVSVDRYQFYVHWPFDVYFHFVGLKVQQRIVSIFEAVVAWTARVGVHYQSRARYRKACIAAIRRHTLKLLRRYYKGAFITKRFQNLLQSFVLAIGNNFAVISAELTHPPALDSVEYVN
jgi:hypothetical protein